MRIPWERLLEISHSIFVQIGSSERESTIVAEHLVGANLRGHDSHGVGMIPLYLRNIAAGTLALNRHPEEVVRNGAIVVMDGGFGFGQVIARESLDHAIPLVREYGLVALSVRNSHHMGRIGAHVERATAEGLICIGFVNVDGDTPRVAPHRGTDARVFTNPVTIGVPATDRTAAIILDFATSMTSVGKCRVAMNEGREMNPGRLIDHLGRPTADPGVLYNNPLGALLPMGEHKGYGLALMCDILGAILCGGRTAGSAGERRGAIVNNGLFLLLDPNRFGHGATLGERIEELERFFKASPPAKPDEPVLVAGEPEAMTLEERKRTGIPIDRVTWGGIVDAAVKVGIDRRRMQEMAGTDEPVVSGTAQ